MGDRLLRVALYIAAMMSLSGCASNCNILSSSNSGACDAMLMGGMIIAAPIAGPIALFSDAASDAKARRMARDWKSSMKTRLANNDIEAIQECLQDCDIRWQYELDYEVRRQLRLDAAQRFLAGDWPQMKPDDYGAYELLAHYALSWQPESAAEDARSVLMPDEVMRSYTLLKEQTVHAPLKKLLSSTRYNRMANTIYGMRFAIDTPNDETAAHAHFNRCPDAMARMMPDDASLTLRTIACSRGYSYYFREPLPEELRKRWDESG